MTSEDQGVHPGLDQRAEVVAGDREQLLSPGDTPLDELDEPGADARHQLHVGGGGESVVIGHRLGRGVGADDPDPARVAGGHRAPGGGVDHLDHRDVVPLAGVAQDRSAGGVAGDDECLDAPVDQVVEALEGVLPHLADRLGAVGLAGGVAEVEDRLVGQLVEHGTGHGEPTEA
jgi:hypothetical protein